MKKKLAILLLLSGLLLVSQSAFAEPLIEDFSTTETSEIQAAPEVNSKATIGFSTKETKAEETEKKVEKPVGRKSIGTFPSMGELLTNNWVVIVGIILIGLIVINYLKRVTNKN